MCKRCLVPCFPRIAGVAPANGKRSNWDSKNAVDFTANGMGLTSGIEGNGVMNYRVDEIRVRRGNSTADWVKANYDTQILGSDFLTYGPVESTARATIVLIY